MRSRVLATLVVVVASGCGRLVSVGDGVVRDRRTGLEWTSRDLGQSLVWEAAERHCRDLRLGQHDGWRLPEIAELRALYDKSIEVPCGERMCHLDPAIRLAGPYVWSVTAPDPGTRFYFDFAFGSSLSPNIGPQLVRRVLCVRRPS